MSLIDALSAARSGLTSTGQRASVASTNIANVQTEGYVRREAILTERGNGVTVEAITRQQDLALVSSRRGAQSAMSRSDMMSSALSRLSVHYGDANSSTGVFAAYSQMQGDLETLRATPESAAALEIAVSSISDLITSINEAAEAIRAERDLADSTLATDISQANSYLEIIHDLNVRIVAQSSGGLDTTELEDQRDAALDSLSEFIPIETTLGSNSRLHVRTASGLTLVGATVHPIEFEPATRVGILDVSEEDGGRLSIPTIDGRGIGPASGAFGLHDGRIAAALSLRDRDLPMQAATLDQFASDLSTAFGDAGIAAMTDAGNPVDPLNTPGLSSRLTLAAALDTSRGGEASALLTGLGTYTPTGDADDTLLQGLVDSVAPLDESLSTLVSGLSSEIYRAERLQVGNQSRFQTLSQSEAQVSSVDLDYELQSLIAIEQAYNANARVIQTVSDMFDQLLSIR